MINGVTVAIQKAGSQKKLAEQLSVTQQFISNCLQRGYFPISRAVEIEEKLGISRFELIDPRVAKALSVS
jgi:DNA-binding transcriptional regulator YdaS (Cro superfamily)